MDTLISLRLPTDLVSRLDIEAEKDRRSRSFIVREAIEQFLPPAPPKRSTKQRRKTIADSELTPEQ